MASISSACGAPERRSRTAAAVFALLLAGVYMVVQPCLAAAEAAAGIAAPDCPVCTGVDAGVPCHSARDHNCTQLDDIAYDDRSGYPPAKEKPVLVFPAYPPPAALSRYRWSGGSRPCEEFARPPASILYCVFLK